MITLRTYKDNGPYFDEQRGSYQAASLKQFIFHVRLAMDDEEDIIGIYDDDGNCKGLWQRELEGHVDSAGDTIVDHMGYELLRPDTNSKWLWEFLQGRLF